MTGQECQRPKPLKIGDIELANRVLLAPMSGVTDAPFRRLTARAPKRNELKLLRQVSQDQTKIFQQEPDRAANLIAVGEQKRDPAFSSVELAAMTAVSQTIMNLDATVWKR